MSIDAETLKKIKELENKKELTDKQEKRLKELKEFRDKFKNKVVPKEDDKEKPKIRKYDPKDFEKFQLPFGGPYKPKPPMSPKEIEKYFMELAKQNPNKKGGMIKGYKKGGAVKKNKSNMITTKGWGASRKT